VLRTLFNSKTFINLERNEQSFYLQSDDVYHDLVRGGIKKKLHEFAQKGIDFVLSGRCKL
jgi:hypothetical protein